MWIHNILYAVPFTLSKHLLGTDIITYTNKTDLIYERS